MVGQNSTMYLETIGYRQHCVCCVANYDKSKKVTHLKKKKAQ